MGTVKKVELHHYAKCRRHVGFLTFRIFLPSDASKVSNSVTMSHFVAIGQTVVEI